MNGNSFLFKSSFGDYFSEHFNVTLAVKKGVNDAKMEF